MIDRGVYDPLEGYRETARDGQTPDQPRTYLEFNSPSQILEYEEPEGHNLVGNYHIQCGAFTMLAGPPDIGKSRAALLLAIAGAIGKGATWFGLPVHCQFRTLILQNENGRVRLRHDFERLKDAGRLPHDVDAWIRVSPPPPFGMVMENLEFRAQLHDEIIKFAPGLLILDPFNSITRDLMERDFHQAFIWLREVLAGCPENTAILILHHLRKPRENEHQKGFNLVNLMAGSYTAASVPRSVMILRRASDDLDSNVMVFSPVKNNDGERGKRAAWELRDGEFFEVPDFDWENFDAGGPGNKRGPVVTIEHLRVVFDNGETWLKLNEAEKKLEEVAEVKRTTAYAALKTWEGPFSKVLRRRDDGKIGLVENEPPFPED